MNSSESLRHLYNRDLVALAKTKGMGSAAVSSSSDPNRANHCSIARPFSTLLTYVSYGCFIHREEEPVVHLEARFAMLQIMGPNEKEHAEWGIMPHE